LHLYFQEKHLNVIQPKEKDESAKRTKEKNVGSARPLKGGKNGTHFP